MEPQKKLLMIVNPRAGRSKPRGPLYDAAAAFCDAGYLLSIRRTAAAGDARRIHRRKQGKRQGQGEQQGQNNPFHDTTDPFCMIFVPDR